MRAKTNFFNKKYIMIRRNNYAKLMMMMMMMMMININKNVLNKEIYKQNDFWEIKQNSQKQL